MKKNGVLVFLSVVLLIGVFLVASGTGGPKIYWHFSFKAFVHMPDTRAVEWAWVTMVEYDTAKAFPGDAATAQQYGGKLEGTSLAFVRGAAWRSAYSYNLDDRCHDRPAKKTISWGESDSDSLFCGGQLFTPQPYRDGTGRVIMGPDKFRLVFTTRKLLHEDGRWEDLKSRAQVFVGAVNVEGRPPVKTKGRFHLQEVNYRDDLEHHYSCDKHWVEQYLTAFRHYNHDPLEDIIPEVGRSTSGADNYGPDHRNQIIYYVLRSTSREHPHWGLRVEWAQPILDREPGESAPGAQPGRNGRTQ